MKNKIILIALGALLVLVTVLIYFSSLKEGASKPVVRSMGEKGIYIGSGKSGLEPVSDDASQFAKTVKGLNEGWENIGLGNSYNNVGQYEEAINAYKRAYDVDPGNRTFIALKLIEVYERAGRYDDALAVLDERSKTKKLSEYGIQEFNIIRVRLLAAKNKSTQP